MTFWQKVIHRLLHAREIQARAEVDDIGALQIAAKQRRAEFAAAQQQAEATPTDAARATLDTARKRMAEAETAYASARQVWDNKEFRRPGFVTRSGRR